jgi:hypothetical protein
LKDTDIRTWFELRLLRFATGTVVANEFGAEAAAAQMGNTREIAESHYIHKSGLAPDHSAQIQGYGVFAGQLRMWRQCAAAENRRMRFLKALGISAVCGELEWTVILLDAVLIAAPVVAATLVAEHLIERGRP